MERRGSGWLLFSSIVLGVAGVMRILDGIWALRYKGALPEALHDGLLGSKLKTYGWLWIVVGVVLLLAGIAIGQRSQFARWIGIIAGAILAISAVFWLPYYPVWSIVYIGIGVGVLYGLSVYGGRDESEVV